MFVGWFTRKGLVEMESWPVIVPELAVGMDSWPVIVPELAVGILHRKFIQTTSELSELCRQ
jgi:hypothetical protein